MSEIEAVQSSQDANSTMLLTASTSTRVSSKELKEALEKGDVSARAEALQHLIRLHLNGESQNHMIMTIIKFITPVDDHLIKKLVLYFWEVVDKTDKDGNLLSVIILICSFLRNDLQHPNEFVRGLTLRFLCKIKEKDLLEPLISAVVANMTHRVTYVRRNAVLAVTAIFKRFPDLLPDAPEAVETFVRDESDATTRRNAFDMLAEFAPERAAHYLFDFREQQQQDFINAGSGFLLSVVEFCKSMIRENPYDKAKYVPILFTVLQAKSSSVRYQCAATLLDLSTSPTAIKEATLTFIDILKTHSDNNVRLIVVGQLDRMRGRYLAVLQSSLMDLLSVLQNGSLEICQRIIELSIELINSKNVVSFTVAMRKELVRASQTDLASAFGVDTSSASAYQRAVIKAVKTAVLRFPVCAPTVLPALMDYVTVDLAASHAVMEVVKEVTEVQPQLRKDTMSRLIELLPMVRSGSVMKTIVWMFGAYLTDAPLILAGLKALHASIAPLPLTAPLAALAARNQGSAMDAASASTTPGRPAMRAVTSVREDGTYVTTYVADQDADRLASQATDGDEESTAGLRRLLCRGEYFLASVLASAYTKSISQLFLLSDVDESTKKAAQSEALTVLHEVLRYGTEDAPVFPMNGSDQEHLRLSIKVIQHPRSGLIEGVLKESRERMAHTAEREGAILSDGAGTLMAPGGNRGGASGSHPPMIAVDAPMLFTQVGSAAGKDAMYEMEAADEAATSEAVAHGASTSGKADAFLKKLEETIPLSGLEEDVYCEASITVNQFDVQVDWLLVNQIDVRLENVTIELMSLGGMRLCERPQAYTIEPRSSLKTRTSLKVSATATGFIYGNVLYDVPGRERCCIILSDIHIDIMTYVRPAVCLPSEFRSMWSLFTWENKVNIATSKYNLREYVALVAKKLNMHVLDPLPDAREDECLKAIPLTASDDEDDVGTCDFASCNLYARTVFGEDALANVSIEQSADGTLSGMIRVRANTQTIAYGIGEKLVTLQQKAVL